MSDNVVPVRPPLLPLDTFLQPIAPGRPAGESIRLDGSFDELKRLREEEPNLPQGTWKRELKRAEWNELAARTAETLRTQSKDLQVAGWLTEAWAHFHGFAGLERGLNLIASLCRDFWNDLHPGADGDQDARGNAIEWLADACRRAARSVPVTAPNREGAIAYTWNDIDSSDKTAKEKAVVSASMTPAPWLASRAAEVGGAIEAVEELDAIVTANLPEDIAPSLVKLRTTLEAIHAFIPVEEKTSVERSADVPVRTEEGADETSALHTNTDIASRAEAYQRLREAADYLLRTEPHSPVPYLVRRAVSWGNLTLAELLEELLAKNADLQTIYTLLGLKGR